MKFVKQLGIILSVSFIGEFLNFILPLPIPASIYGLVLMLLALQVKLIRPEQVKETAIYLIEIMPMMFLPAILGLMTAWEDLQPFLIPVIAITILSLIFVMGVTGQVTQQIIFWERRRKR
ncbi:MAG: CidA/LrgA family protein [Clostridiales bacterium]|nr:CidA/LrgA family protein [Clostridiales bacterium]